MPRSLGSFRVCAHDLCPLLVPRGKSYCPDHQREIDQATRAAREREGTARTIRGWRIAKMRKAILAEQGGLCALCHEPIVDEPGILDHIEPRWQGGSDERSNLQVLHADPCHKNKTRAEGRPPARGELSPPPPPPPTRDTSLDAIYRERVGVVEAMWESSDEEIAEHLGISVTRVRRMREAVLNAIDAER